MLTMGCSDIQYVLNQQHFMGFSNFVLQPKTFKHLKMVRQKMLFSQVLYNPLYFIMINCNKKIKRKTEIARNKEDRQAE